MDADTNSEDPTKPNEDYDERDGMLRCLSVVDYRYSRFALDPRTGLFNMIRYVVRVHLHVKAKLRVFSETGETLP